MTINIPFITTLEIKITFYVLYYYKIYYSFINKNQNLSLNSLYFLILNNLLYLLLIY